MPNLFTKTAYVKGLQSPKLLWEYMNDRESIPDHDEATLDRFNQGAQVEEHAHTLFDGVDLSTLDFGDNLNKTDLVIDSKKTVFEPGFMSGRLYARSDVLEPVEDGWCLYEIKMSTKPKEYHLHDLSFQKHVLERNGLTISQVKLILIDRSYVRDGEVEPEKLLHIEDVTDDVVEAQKGISKRIAEMQSIIQKISPPDFDKHNLKEYYHDNHLKDEFETSLDQDSVYHLYYGGDKVYELWSEGIEEISSVDEKRLSEKQRVQKKAIQDKPYMDEEKIKGFLEQIEKPISYVDFEAFNNAVPLFDKCQPYEQVPFQYSLHIENDSVKHTAFLYEGRDDPRPAFLESLLQDLPDEGSIIVWYDSFEKNVLDAVAELTGKQEEVDEIKKRIIDLRTIFKNFWYYHPEQRGSTSLKAVYPVFAEENGYDSLDIEKGDKAAVTYKQNRRDLSDEVKKKLLEYCKLDTYSMKVIKDRLLNS